MSDQPSFAAITSPPLTYKEYTLRSFTLKDWGEFCEYYAFIPYQLARKNNVSQEHEKEIFSQCVSHLKILGPQNEEVLRFLFSEAGFLKAVEISLIRGGTPKNKVLALIDSEEDSLYIELAKKLYCLLGFSAMFEVAEDKENPPMPNQSQEL